MDPREAIGSLRHLRDLFWHFAVEHQWEVTLTLCIAAFLAFIIIVAQIFRYATLMKQVDLLQASLRRLTSSVERRILRDLRNQPRARLLLEGPKPIRTASLSERDPLHKTK